MMPVSPESEPTVDIGSWRYQPDGDERLKRNEMALKLLGRMGPGYKSQGEMVQEFRFLKLGSLLRLQRIERRQDLDSEVEWMKSSDEPLLLIFVSHRWKSKDHPDPHGRQLNTLKRFARQLLDIAVACRELPARRLELVSTLRTYGALQAAFFVGELSRFLEHFNEGVPELRFALLNRIGIWYDFMSLPQRVHREGEQEEFDKRLHNLQRLVASALVLSLRDEGDDYAHRAWCELEFWSGCKLRADHTCTVPVVRMDLWGGELDLGALGPPINYTSRQDFNKVMGAIHAWESCEQRSGIKLVQAIRMHYFLAFSLKEKQFPVPLLTRPDFRAHDEPNIEETPVSFQLWYTVRELLCLKGLHEDDFAEILKNKTQEVGLHCTERKDIVPTCLWLLGAHELLFDYGFVVFYGRCFIRYLVEGKDLRVNVFERLPNQCVHFQFADGEEAIEG